MDIFGNFHHLVSNIVQNVKFLQLKKKKKLELKNNYILQLLKNNKSSTILGLTVAISCNSKSVETLDQKISRKVLHRVKF